MVVIYPDKIAVIYPDKAANLLKLKNQREVRFSRPKIFKRFGGIVREVINWPICPGVNGEPQVKVKRGRYTSRSRPVLPKRKLEGFKLILELIRDNKKTVTIKAKALRKRRGPSRTNGVYVGEPWYAIAGCGYLARRGRPG